MVVTIANTSVRSGHKVGVCLLVGGGPLIDQLDKRVELYSLNRRWRFDWKALKKFASLARQYDLLHVHLKHNLKYVYATHFLLELKIPVLLHDHSAEVLIEGVPKTHLPFFVVRWLRKQYYLAVSERLMQWSIVNFSLDPARAFWLSNVIDCKQVTHRPQTNSEEIKLLLVSNFRRIKNIEFAVDLIAEMLKRQLPATLDIIGKPLNKLYFEKILNKIQVLRLTDKIRIKQDVNDVSAILSDYTLGLHCSKAETGPLVLLEFMCGGLPFVSIATGEISCHVKENYSELVLDEFNVSKWIEQIRYLILDLDPWPKRLRSFFDHNYSIDAYFGKLNSIYSKIVF